MSEKVPPVRKRQKVPLWQWVKQTGNVFQCLPLKTAGDLQFVNPSEKELQRLVHSQIHVENLQWKLNAILFVYGNSYFWYFNDEFNYRKGNLWGGNNVGFSSRFQSLQRIKYIYQVQHLGQLEVFSFAFSVLIRNLKKSSLFFVSTYTQNIFDVSSESKKKHNFTMSVLSSWF